LKLQRFLKPEPTRINGRKECAVASGSDVSDDIVHLFDSEHRRHPVFGLCPGDFEDVPITLGNVLKEEAAAGIAALHGVGRPFADISAMEEYP
jgi:hypothetical protein